MLVLKKLVSKESNIRMILYQSIVSLGSQVLKMYDAHKNQSYLLSQQELQEREKHLMTHIGKEVELIMQQANSVSLEKQNEIVQLSAIEIRNAIVSFKYTCKEVLISFAARAATIGRKLNLTAYFNFSEALKEAEEKDQLLQTNQSNQEFLQKLPPFFGVPISCKEQLKIKGFLNTCGFMKNANGTLSPVDNLVISKIRLEGGAIPFISSNVPQGLFSVECHNSVYGQGKNPWNQKLTCGGSSGGECGLIATQCSPLGFCSDSAGSIRIPSSFCGICGFKPTGQRVSKKGRVGIAGSEIDALREVVPSIGPVSHSVSDIIQAAKLFLGNFGSQDLNVIPMKFDEQLFNEVNLKELKIGYLYETPLCPTVPALKNVVNEVVSKLKENGFKNVVPFEYPGEVLDKLFQCVYEFISTPGAQKAINQLLQGEKPLDMHEPYVEFQRLPRFLQNLKIDVEKSKNQFRWSQILENHQEKKGILEYLMVFQKKEVLRNQLLDYWTKEKFDIIISPVLPFTACLHGDGVYLVNYLTLASYQNILDFPSGVVPIRTVKPEETSYEDKYNDKITERLKRLTENSVGIPASIEITSAIWKDEICLKFMQYLQQTFKFSEKPKLQ